MPSIVKTRTTVYKVLQARPDMMIFNEDYRRIRSAFRYKGFQCFNCHYRFKNGDKIGMTITDKGNKVLCHDCATKFEKELREAT